MAELRVGIAAHGGDARERRATLARAADRGVDHVMVGDHVSFFVGFGTDALIQATALLNLHPTLPVFVGVYLLPLRHPVVVARQLADISGMAPGRLILGVGVGGEDRHEVELCGVDPRTRGRRMDECLEVIRGLAAGTPFSFHGEFFRLEEAVVLPPPAPPVPIVIGGRSDAAVRRAARLGDGWLGIWVSPPRYASVVGQIDELAGHAGRAGVCWTHAMQMWASVGSSREEARPRLARAMEAVYHLPFDSFERYSPCGTPQDLAEFLAPYVEAGCTTFNLIPGGTPGDEMVDAVAEIKRLLGSPG
ncbi:MAG TPA: LLM class flavin-dependent oxidoreductase [Acidimicrobiales bacterium]|nr:LLM class flavin-dependent oxidoreductase [Acidimicrobiales bacterium]